MGQQVDVPLEVQESNIQTLHGPSGPEDKRLHPLLKTFLVKQEIGPGSALSTTRPFLPSKGINVGVNRHCPKSVILTYSSTQGHICLALYHQ